MMIMYIILFCRSYLAQSFNLCSGFIKSNKYLIIMMLLYTSKKIKFPAVLRLQDRAQFHVLFSTHILEILGNSRTSVENCT